MRQWERLAMGTAIAFAVGALPSAADAAKGKEVYASAAPKCKVCHSIGGEGNAKGSLDGIGSKLAALGLPALRSARWTPSAYCLACSSWQASHDWARTKA